MCYKSVYKLIAITMTLPTNPIAMSTYLTINSYRRFMAFRRSFSFICFGPPAASSATATFLHVVSNLFKSFR